MKKLFSSSIMLISLLIGNAFVFLPNAAVAASSSQTSQGIMVNLNAEGTFSVVDNKLYKFNVNDSTLIDANGVMLPASAYFTNTLTSGPVVVCNGSSTNCASSNKPLATTPSPDASKVTAANGVCWQQRCVFLDGGTLTGSAYTQSVTVSGLNGHGNWIFTWTYTVAPDATKDVDAVTDGVQVNPFTAWVLEKETNDGLAHISVAAQLTGESVVKNSNPKIGTKYSFSLLNNDGSSRVQNLEVTVMDSSGSIVAAANPNSSVNYPVDFNYTTNAGSNGVTSLLQNGDARTILNTDSFAGNNNGGSDGSALALATMDSVALDLGPGDYTVTLTGTVKDNDISLNPIPFSVTQIVHIITPGCSAN